MKKDFFSERALSLPAPKLQIDFAKAHAEGVISLSIGEPDFETPWSIKEAGIESIEEGDTFYADDAGYAPLREELARYLFRHYGVSYDPKDEILITVGASEAIDLAFRALLNEGEEVLLPVPAYVSYAPLIALNGGKVVGVPLREEKKFRLQKEDLLASASEKSKILLLNYPHNPTGAIMERNDLLALSETIQKRDLFVLSDEIYAELTYGRKHVSIASLPGMKERTLLISGFSKAFAMTGWRLGYAAGSKEVIKAMRRIHQYSLLAAPTLSQFAALKALEEGEEETKKMREAYDMRRHFVIESFAKMDLPCFTPEGAFYAFPCIKGCGFSSDEFVSRLYEEEKLLLISGTGFGPEGEGFVRLSYAYSLPKLQEGLARLAAFTKKHRLS